MGLTVEWFHLAVLQLWLTTKIFLPQYTAGIICQNTTREWSSERAGTNSWYSARHETKKKYGWHEQRLSTECLILAYVFHKRSDERQDSCRPYFLPCLGLLALWIPKAWPTCQNIGFSPLSALIWTQKCLTLSLPCPLGIISPLSMVWNADFETFCTAHERTASSEVKKGNYILVSYAICFSSHLALIFEHAPKSHDRQSRK